MAGQKSPMQRLEERKVALKMQVQMPLRQQYQQLNIQKNDVTELATYLAPQYGLMFCVSIAI